MRVLVSAHWLGGKGGAERELHGILHALSQDSVDLVYRVERGGQWAEVPRTTRARPVQHLRWRGGGANPGNRLRLAKPLVNFMRRGFGSHYDLHIALGHGPDISAASRATVRLLVPNGLDLRTHQWATGYRVALEAPDNDRYLAEDTPAVVLPPPYYDLAPLALKPPDTPLPPRYLLTVFNPNSAAKGMDVLLGSVDDLPMPLVWCHRDDRMSFSHPNIIHVIDPPPEVMRFLYEGCEAYVSFSTTESFGYSLADALRYSRRIVSRPVGVLSFPEVRGMPGIHFVESDEWHVDWPSVFQGQRPDAPTRDLGWLAPNAYRDRLQQLLRQMGSSSSA